MEDQKVYQTIRNTVRQYLPNSTYHLFIFGSRAQGTYRKYSDFDVAIDGPEKVPSHTMGKIRSELEDTDVPYVIDLVDLNQTSDGFKKSAYQFKIDL